VDQGQSVIKGGGGTRKNPGAALRKKKKGNPRKRVEHVKSREFERIRCLPYTVRSEEDRFSSATRKKGFVTTAPER